jgi:hypothetical protein
MATAQEVGLRAFPEILRLGVDLYEIKVNTFAKRFLFIVPDALR